MDQSLRQSLRSPGPVRFQLVVSSEEPGRTVVRVRGELDVFTAPKLAGDLDAVVRRSSGEVVVDLDEVDFIDSAGLHVLLNTQRRLMRRSRRLAVLCRPGPVRRVIELARLVETLRVATPAGVDQA